MSFVNIVSISIARTIPISSGEEIQIPDILDDYGWDIDRWENDGGRSLGTNPTWIET